MREEVLKAKTDFKIFTEERFRMTTTEPVCSLQEGTDPLQN